VAHEWPCGYLREETMDVWFSGRDFDQHDDVMCQQVWRDWLGHGINIEWRKRGKKK